MRPRAAGYSRLAGGGGEAVVHVPSEREASTVGTLLRRACCGLHTLLHEELRASPEGEQRAQPHLGQSESCLRWPVAPGLHTVHVNSKKLGALTTPSAPGPEGQEPKPFFLPTGRPHGDGGRAAAA